MNGPESCKLSLYPSGSIVTDIACIEDGDNVIIQKHFTKQITDQNSEEDDDLLAEEVRLHEEEQRVASFNRVCFFRRLKEFTRLNKSYISICSDI